MTETGSTVEAPRGAVSKGFVEVRGRRLHYIRQGDGPAAVLLHASPCSAKVMAPLQAAWAGDFTTFAFDLPGFGLSELPDAAEITIPVLADAIAAGMRELGLENAALYGRHTGASVGLELARRHPELAAMLLTDGLPVFAKPYSEERLAEYLPRIEPRWDGGHLTWTFFRYREQHLFWPWDSADLAHRADADMPSLDFLHRGTLELLEAASTYAQVYRAAFLYETLPNIGDLKIPAFYGNRPGDSQYATVERYPAWAEVRLMPRSAQEAAEAELALFRQHPAQGRVPEWRSRFGPASGQNAIRDYIATRHGLVYARGEGLTQGGRPTLFLHDMPGGIDLHQEEIAAVGSGRPVIAFDLGGNGNSEIAGSGDTELWVDQIQDVLAALAWDRVDIHAHGTSGGLAAAFAKARPEKVGALVLRAPPLLSREQRAAFAGRSAPDISPAGDGGYLLRLWHHLRDQELWWPWFDQRHGARKRTEPRIAPDWLHRRAVIMLKQPWNYARIWDEILAQDLFAMLADLAVPCQIVVQSQDVFAACAERNVQTRQGIVPVQTISEQGEMRQAQQ